MLDGISNDFPAVTKGYTRNALPSKARIVTFDSAIALPRTSKIMERLPRKNVRTPG